MNAAEIRQMEALENQRALENLGRQLAAGSDYLTHEIRMYVQFGDLRNYQNFWEEVNHTRSREVLEDLIRLKALPEEIEFIRKSKAYSDHLIKTEEQAMQAVKDKDFDEARKLVFGKYYQEQKGLIMGNIGEFQSLIEKRTSQAVQKAQNQTGFYMLATNTCLAVAGLLVLYALVNIVRRRMIVPLENLTRVMRNDPAGNLEFEASLPAVKDEIYELTAAFNKMISEIKIAKDNEISYIREKELAERASQAKSEFLSSMSHELRTPLNAVIGFSQLLQGCELERDQRIYADHILKGGKHLLVLISEILDFAEMETKGLNLELADVNLNKAVEDTLDSLYPLARDKSISLVNGIQDKAFWVKGDYTKLKQAVRNLVVNGIKYNNSGGKVILHAERIAPQKIQLVVEDTGIGIPEDKLGQIFEPFARLRLEPVTTEGSGIGLTVVKKILGMMRGKISVDSTLGKGSRFVIELEEGEAVGESEHASKAVHLKKTEDTPEDEKNQKLVLCVEDNPSNLELIERIISLMPDNIALVSATTGKQAVQEARLHRPDLILMDIYLPDMTGIEVVRQLKRDKATNEIPVIAISAYALESDRELARKVGIDIYLTKPLDFIQFTKALQTYLN